jgi:Trk K+ transport system NAD-binding subunit
MAPIQPSKSQPYAQVIVPPIRQRPLSRFVRLVRAVGRDTFALMREFQRPLIAFVLATVGLGLLYWWLMGQVGVEQPPLHNMPYIMLALMVLETPIDVPTQPQLIVFWYLMPLIAVYVIGRGVTDFVRLFFNRGERRAAWEEAVVTTYRNHIIVMGAGNVGMRVTRVLTQMGFEVVMIDRSLPLERADELDRLDVPTIIGDARLAQTLEKAGLPHAEAFIACTSDDQINLEAIMGVRDMHPTIRIIARMWDARFAKQIKQFMGVNVVLSASELAAPVFAGAAVGLDITQTLTVNGREYSMIRMTVAAGAFMDGRTVGELQHKYDIDIVLYAREDMVDVHPPAAQVLTAGDTVVIFASHDRITDLVARNRSGRR